MGWKVEKYGSCKSLVDSLMLLKVSAIKFSLYSLNF